MKILLSYSLAHFDPAKKPEEQKYWGSSANILARTLYKVLSEFGEVTCTDGDHFRHLSGREYDLFVGIENHFSEILDACRIKRSIFWAVNMHPAERNRLLREFAERERIPSRAFADWDLTNPQVIGRALRKADFILVVGGMPVLNSYIRHGIPKRKVRVLNYGVGGATTAKKTRSKGPMRYLYVSSEIGLRKGFDILADLFTRLDRRGEKFRLDVIGSTTTSYYKRKLNRLRERLGRKVTYHGWVGANTLRYQKLLREADFLVYPALEEGQAGTVLDALRQGVIPILSPHTGVDFSPLGLLETRIGSAVNLRILRQSLKVLSSELYHLRRKGLEYYRELHQDFEAPLREVIAGCLKGQLYPKISVILPIFNKERVIRSILRHLDRACREYGNIELFVILDGCRDRSEERTQGFFRKKHSYPVRFFVTPNIFEVRSNNLGLKRACGKYTTVTQDDIYIYDRNFFFEVVTFLEKNPTAAIVGTLAGVNYYPRGTKLRGKGQIAINENEAYWRQDEQTDPTLKQKIFEVDACMRGPLFIRKSFLEEHGYIDEVYAPMHQDDMDLCFRTRKFGKKVYCLLGDVANKSLTVAHYTKKQSDFWEKVVKRNTDIFYRRYAPTIRKDYLWMHRFPYVASGWEILQERVKATTLAVFGWAGRNIFRVVRAPYVLARRVGSKIKRILLG